MMGFGGKVLQALEGVAIASANDAAAAVAVARRFRLPTPIRRRVR